MTAQEPITNVQERPVPARTVNLVVAVVTGIALAVVGIAVTVGIVSDDPDMVAAAYQQGKDEGRKAGYAQGHEHGYEKGYGACREEADAGRERGEGRFDELPSRRGLCDGDAYEKAIDERFRMKGVYDELSAALDRVEQLEAAEQPVVIVVDGNGGAGGITSICSATAAQLAALAAEGVEVNKNLDRC